MLDILSIGNASLDVILQSKAFKVHRDEHSPNGHAQTLTFGTKIEVDEMYTSPGGGALNSATTFARQELGVGIVTQYGEDYGGKVISTHLKDEGVRTQYALVDEHIQTPLSTVLLTYTGERTVLAYRGHNRTMAVKQLHLKDAQVKWYYITSLGGDIDTLTSLLEHAHHNAIKTAVNPGRMELACDDFKALLPYIDVLILNREESEYIVPKEERDEHGLFGAMNKLRQGVTLVTNGARGAAASDGFNSYFVEPAGVKVVDRLGAGDAFGSGFVAGFIRYGEMEKALQLAASNAGSVCEKYGSTAGILHASQRLRKVAVSKHPL